MSDPIEEYCKKEILNTSLFRDNSAKFLDPTFDVKAFLCEVLKVTDMPNINPILKEEKPPFYPQKTDYSGLAEVGDPRVSLGLTLSAGFTNFMPRNIVYTETLKYGGTQIINDIICDSDGNPIKISTSNSIQDMEQSQKELEISSILNSEEVKNTYPNYNFSQSICLEQPEIKIADLSQSIDQIDAESLPTIEPFSKEHKDLFSYDTSLDLCTKPLDLESLFIPTTPDEYTEFTKNFMLFGKEQHTLYFIAFLKKFFTARGGTITLHESEIPPMFFVKIKQRITSENVDIIVTKKVTPATKLGGTDIITYQYKSNVKYTYFKYWNDQTTNISKYLNISEKIVNTTTGIKGTSNSMFRTLVESVPDYKRIMKNPTLQKKFYQYAKRYYVEIPEYYDTNEYTDNPTRKAFVL
jgi:hypothetical protein